MFLKNAAKVANFAVASVIVFGSLWLLDASLESPKAVVVEAETSAPAQEASLVVEEPVDEPEAWLMRQLSESDEREVHALAIALYFEARGESITGQQKVAEVIFRRVIDPRWPNTVEAVIKDGEERLHGCQFSFMCDGRPENPVDENAWTLASFSAGAIYDRYLRGELKVGCAHSYHADYATNTAYFRGLDPVEQVGSHIFYCDRAM